jgi:type II secretory pathway predicted ATPase ExeA
LYEKYWGFSASPFQNVPDPTFYFPSAMHQEGLNRLLYTVEHGKGAAMLTGEIGCGKTTLARAFMNLLTEDKYDVALITNPDLPRDEFLQEVNRQFSIEAPGRTKAQLWRALTSRCSENLAAGRDTVLIVDEAHCIRDNEVFEELRQILNLQLNDRYLISLILLGQPELKAQVAQNRQLDQRIAIRYHLGPLDWPETLKYVQYRIQLAGSKREIFSPEALQLIWQCSSGIPRNINNLADLCLLDGFRSQRPVIDGAMVRKAAAEIASV